MKQIAVGTPIDQMIRGVKPIRVNGPAAKYHVDTWGGYTHELQVYRSRGGADIAYEFEVNGTVEGRRQFADRSGAFVAGLDAIRAIPPTGRAWRVSGGI